MTFTQPGTARRKSERLPNRNLPTMYDLPSEFPEEPGLPDVFHHAQPELLSLSLTLQNYSNSEFFIGTDLNLYYDSANPLYHKRPDWFLAVGVPPLYNSADMRLSYVAWQEPANPYLVVELISPGTGDEDLGKTTAGPGDPPTKWTVYEQILKVPYYVVFNRYTDELHIFKLENGRYQKQSVLNGRYWIPELKIGIGLWQGTYRQGTFRLWLRWLNEEGEWLLTDAEKQRQRADAAEAALAALKARLEAQGIDPSSL